MVERFASVPSPMTAILLEHFHGAVTRVGVTDTAVPHRAEGWNLLLPSVWTDPGGDGREHRLDARDAPRASARTSSEARWLNYLGDDQGDDAVRAAYGPNYERLLDAQAPRTTRRTSSTTTTTSTRARHRDQRRNPPEACRSGARANATQRWCARCGRAAQRKLALQVESCSPRLLRLARHRRVGRLRAFGRGSGRRASYDTLAHLERGCGCAGESDGAAGSRLGCGQRVGSSC